MKDKKRNSTLAFILWLGLALILGSCNLPGGSSPTAVSPDSLSTFVAATFQAQANQTQLAASSLSPTEILAPTDTPVPLVLPTDTQPAAPLDTATSTESPATATETATLTSSIPLISAEQDTRCRLGPSTVYDVVGFLLTTEQSTVQGKDSGGEWWYIENPKKPGAFCWVWGGSTKVSGNTSALPVITPPPTPTFTATVGVSFSLSYDNVHNCSGTPTAIFTVKNNGGGTLESLNLKIEDITSSTTLYASATSNAPFLGTSGECPSGGDSLPAGKTYYVGGAIGAGNSGHTARATVKLCTEDDLDGVCTTKNVEFTIP